MMKLVGMSTLALGVSALQLQGGLDAVTSAATPTAETAVSKVDAIAQAASQPLDEKEHKATIDSATPTSINRYRTVKWGTRVLDYSFVIALFYKMNLWYGGANWSPSAAAKMMIWFFTGITMQDFLKAFLFRDVVAKAKLDHLRSLWSQLLGLFSRPAEGAQQIKDFAARLAAGEGITHDFKDKSAHRHGVLYHIFYFLKTAMFQIPLAVALQTAIGMFTFRPLMDTVATVGAGQWYELNIPVIAYVYFEYHAMSFLKDALSMNIFHEMMHRQYYDLHKTHHLPMKELSMVNVFYFDLPDLVIENIVSPALLMALKLGLAPNSSGPVSIHALSSLLLTMTDANCHSISPYSVGFFNPILDSMMNPNVSHTLHHALNIGHYTFFPWHQLPGVARYDATTKSNLDSSKESDMATYNRVFKTNFPENC